MSGDGGDGVGNGGSSGGGGDDGQGENGANGDEGDWRTMLQKLGRDASTLPEDFRQALQVRSISRYFLFLAAKYM